MPMPCPVFGCVASSHVDGRRRRVALIFEPALASRMPVRVGSKADLVGAENPAIAFAVLHAFCTASSGISHVLLFVQAPVEDALAIVVRVVFCATCVRRRMPRVSVISERINGLASGLSGCALSFLQFVHLAIAASRISVPVRTRRATAIQKDEHE